MQSVKGLIQVTGVYKNGEMFLDNKRCPFQAKLGATSAGTTLLTISLAVPAAEAGSILEGLASADLTLDNVPSLVEQVEPA